MSTRNLSTLEKLAIEAAISPPVRQGKYSVDASVPWALIKDIRAELDKLGIDWKGIRERMIEIKNERRHQAGVGR